MPPRPSIRPLVGLAIVLLAAEGFGQVWMLGSPMVRDRAGHGLAVSGHCIYAVGGHSDLGVTPPPFNSVEFAAISATGEVDTWAETCALNTRRTLTTATATNTHVYVIGGAGGDGGIVGNELSSVEFSEIQMDGSLGHWMETSPLVIARGNAGSFARDGYVYVVAGYGGGQLNSVERATILGDCSLGAWEILTSTLVAPRERPGVAVIQNHVAVVGGLSYSSGGIVATTEFSEILPDGSLGLWEPGPPLAVPRYKLALSASEHQLIAIGGYNDGSPAAFAHTEIATWEEGGLGAWSTGPAMAEPRAVSAAVRAGSFVIVSGGNPANPGIEALDSVEVFRFGPEPFVRGDCNVDGSVQLADAVALLVTLFEDGSPQCYDACDSNDDGALDLADGVHVLDYLFAGGTTPASPFPACGVEPNFDELDCAASSCAQT